jgi:outer membrane protein
MDHSARPFACYALILAAVALLHFSHTARAQDDNGFSLGVDGSVGVGGSVGIKPRYEGSKEYRAFGFPLVMPKLGNANSAFAGRVKFRGLDDVRFRAFEMGGFEFGPLAGYKFGRQEDDGDLLRGLGDVDNGLVLGAYAGYRFGTVLFDVSYNQIVTGDHNGYQIRFGAEVERKFTSRLSVIARVGSTFADDNYMSSNFGVSALQAYGSFAGLPAFDAEAGIKDVHFELGTATDLTDRWKLRVGGRYSRLLGDAADSPVIETKDQFSAIVGLSYRFDIRR